MYGYDPAGQVIDAEAVIVREIFERMAASDPMWVVTNDLNARGIPSPGTRWDRTERRHDGRCLSSALNADACRSEQQACAASCFRCCSYASTAEVALSRRASMARTISAARTHRVGMPRAR